MSVIIVIVLLLIAMLLLRRSRQAQDRGKATNLRRIGLVLAVAALVLALVDAADMALDNPDEEVPTLTGDRLP